MFSYHLAELPAAVGIRAMWHPPSAGDVPGLRHGEALAFMQLASPTVSRQRMQVRRVAYFARWDDEEALDRFLTRHPLGTALADGWHVRMDFLRRFGALACFPDLPGRSGSWVQDEPVVAVTLARLRLPELPRFLRWGKPVERLVVDHPGTALALAAMRPPRHFSTFSLWRSVADMDAMVHGHGPDVPGPGGPVSAGVHTHAMAEQRRRDFHLESAFMRFRPRSEHGSWRGRSGWLPT